MRPEKSKQDGTLWAELAKRNEISRWFHIGDNLIGDVRYPKIHGFHVLEQNLRINSPLEQFYENPLSTVLGKYLEGNISEKLILGKIIAFLYSIRLFLLKETKQLVRGLAQFLEVSWIFFKKSLINYQILSCFFVTREGYIFKPLLRNTVRS